MASSFTHLQRHVSGLPLPRRSRKALALLFVGLLLFAACGTQPSTSPTEGKPLVATGFYPLFEFAGQVGGDRVEVRNLAPAGAEPHDLDLTRRDLDLLRRARLLLYIGGFQPALERAVKTLDAPSLAAVDLAQEPSQLGAEGPAGENGLGPHIWLDPLLAKGVVAKIADALVATDPGGKGVFERNAQAYIAQLDTLDSEFQTALQGCRLKEFITSHAAFAYLARRYNLTQVPITGLSPEVEPSPQRMREVIQLARERGIKVIYFEPLVNPRVVETIAREVGATTMVLNPIEGLTREEEAQGAGYLQLMRQNLANLKVGLECP